MTIQELLKARDAYKIAKLWLEKRSEEEPHWDVNHIAEAVQTFCDMLVGLTPKPTQNVVLALPSFRANEVEAVWFHQDVLARSLSKLATWCGPTLSEHPTEEEIQAVLDVAGDLLPEGYAIESSSWEDLLSAEVCQANCERMGKDQLIASVLLQMSLVGTGWEECKHRRREQIAKLENGEMSRKNTDATTFTLEESIRMLEEQYYLTFPETRQEPRNIQRLNMARTICARLQELQKVAQSGWIAYVQLTAEQQNTQCASDEWECTIDLTEEEKQALDDFCAERHITIDDLFEKFLIWSIEDPERTKQWLMDAMRQQSDQDGHM